MTELVFISRKTMCQVDGCSLVAIHVVEGDKYLAEPFSLELCTQHFRYLSGHYYYWSVRDVPKWNQVGEEKYNISSLFSKRT